MGESVTGMVLSVGCVCGEDMFVADWNILRTAIMKISKTIIARLLIMIGLIFLRGVFSCGGWGGLGCRAVALEAAAGVGMAPACGDWGGLGCCAVALEAAAGVGMAPACGGWG